MQDATRLSISGISIKGLTVSKPLFGKEKMVETSISGKVKYVKVSFSVPASETVRQGEYVLIASLYSVKNLKGISKEIPINYNGKEQLVSTIFDSPKTFMAGSHKVEITLGKRVMLTDSLILK